MDILLAVENSIFVCENIIVSEVNFIDIKRQIYLEVIDQFVFCQILLLHFLKKWS